MAALAVVLGAVFAIIKIVKGLGNDEAKHTRRVREFVSLGQFKEAARLQIGKGRRLEALRLLERGQVWGEASRLAQEMLQLERAAKFAERGQEFERAADLYVELEQFGTAGKFYKRVGKFRQAAEALERDPHSDIEDIARMWQNACLELVTDDGVVQEDLEVLSQTRLTAGRAAECWKKAGNQERAAEFYELADNPANGNQLMTNLSNTRHGKSGPKQGDIAEAVAVAVKEAIKHTVGPSKVTAIDGEGVAGRESADRYELGKKLGEGGMAEVFKATDSALGREVALKFLPPGMSQNELALRYFEREARAAARLSHPNVVTIYDCGMMGDRPFISMEYIEGQTLEDRLEDMRPEGGLPVDEVLEVAEAILSALEAVHSEGVVHRDIKPSNIMRTARGIPKLMDFGIAGGNDAERRTFVVGTPFYMAPEQFVGTGIDHRSDLFALGATLFELITAERPFAGASRTRVPRRLGTLRPSVPFALDALVARCLMFESERRPESASECLSIVRDLRQARQLADSGLVVAMVQPDASSADSVMDSAPNTAELRQVPRPRKAANNDTMRGAPEPKIVGRKSPASRPTRRPTPPKSRPRSNGWKRSARASAPQSRPVARAVQSEPKPVRALASAPVVPPPSSNGQGINTEVADMLKAYLSQ